MNTLHLKWMRITVKVQQMLDDKSRCESAERIADTLIARVRSRYFPYERPLR